MDQASIYPFAHRPNYDGTHDSICRGCFKTIASVRNEPELAHHELAHLCTPEPDWRSHLLRPGQWISQAKHC